MAEEENTLLSPPRDPGLLLLGATWMGWCCHGWGLAVVLVSGLAACSCPPCCRWGGLGHAPPCAWCPPGALCLALLWLWVPPWAAAVARGEGVSGRTMALSPFWCFPKEPCGAGLLGK